VVSQRRAFRFKIKPGTGEEYDRRHAAVWPDMIAAIKEAGYRNYSIYRDGETLFGYFEADDPDETWRRIAESDAANRWEEMMLDILDRDLDPTTGTPKGLPEVFHVD